MLGVFDQRATEMAPPGMRRRTSVEVETTAVRELSTNAGRTPAPPTNGRASSRRRTSVRFADDGEGRSLDGAGRPRQSSRSLVVSETGAVLPTPQALDSVTQDPSTRALLAAHRAAILAALGAAAAAPSADGSATGGPNSSALHPDVFQRTMHSLQLGFEAKQVEDLLEVLLYLGRLGVARGGMTRAASPEGTELVYFSLLFNDATDQSEEEDEPLTRKRRTNSMINRTSSAEEAGEVELVDVKKPLPPELDAPLPPGLVCEAPQERDRREKWDAINELGEKRHSGGMNFRLPSVETLMPEAEEAEIIAMLEASAATGDESDEEESEEDEMPTTNDLSVDQVCD